MEPTVSAMRARAISFPRFGTLTLNPALDCTLVLEDRLCAGHVHAVRSETIRPGGKGINVARLLAARGAAVCVGGLVGAAEADAFRLSLPAAVDFRFRTVPAPTRRNLMLCADGREYKINRPGFPDLAFDWETVCQAADAVVAHADIVLLSGSLPTRFPADVYQRLVRRIQGAGRTVVLDTHGAALALALDAGPDWVKPNRAECAAWLGRPIRGRAGIRRALNALTRKAAGAILSDGARGAGFAVDGQAVFAAAPAVRAVESTGAGDALLAQFCFDFFTRGFNSATVCRAVAAGAVAVEHAVGTPPDLNRIDHLATRVVVSPL